VIGQEGAWGDCQTCGVPILGATFTRQGNTWVVVWQGEDDGVDLAVTEQTPPGELVKTGPDHHGYLFRHTLTSQGFLASSLALFGEANGVFAQLVSIPFYSESMAKPGAAWANWKYDSTYEFVPGENPDYFDLHVTTGGTAPADGQIVRFSTERVYTYRRQDTIFGGGYEQQDTSTPPPTQTSLPDPSFTLRQALGMLYGQYPGAVVSDTMVSIPVEHLGWFINVVLAAPYDEAGRHKLVVLTEWAKGPRDGGDNACDSCGADLGGGIFVKSGSTWVAETKDISNTLDNIGTWGHVPDGYLVQIGPNRHGFMFFPYKGGLGSSDQLMYLYAEVAGRLKRIAVFDGFNESYPAYPGDNGWIGGHRSVYQFRPGQNPGYYDLYVDATGHCDGQGWPLVTCDLRVYTFNGSEYVQTSGPALPTSESP
jgi:hypothetical protein